MPWLLCCPGNEAVWLAAGQEHGARLGSAAAGSHGHAAAGCAPQHGTRSALWQACRARSCWCSTSSATSGGGCWHVGLRHNVRPLSAVLTAAALDALPAAPMTRTCREPSELAVGLARSDETPGAGGPAGRAGSAEHGRAGRGPCSRAGRGVAA